MTSEFNGPTFYQDGDHNRMEVYQNTYTVTPTELDEAAQELADAVRDYWDQEAAYRRLHKITVPVGWQVSRQRLTTRVTAATAEGAPPRFTPLPGIAPVTAKGLRKGGDLTDLHKVYGGLASGRLLIVGPPAAGKTSAAVLLLRQALQYREGAATPQHRSRIPVPVLMSLDGWAPDGEWENAVDWAAQRLSLLYEEPRHLHQLLKAGRIALFLDGFDEVGEEVRALAVTALESAPFRVVLISRTDEAVDTARVELPAGAVALELQPVRPADAAEYLLDSLENPAPAAWQKVVQRLLDEPESALAQALADPLTVSLLQETYGPHGPVEEVLDLHDADRIRDHLLDHAVTAAYTRKPRPNGCRPYSAAAAERTLRYLAVRLTEDGTRQLRWWQIPTGAHRPSGAWIVAVAVGYVAVVALTMAPFIGLRWGVTLGLTGCLLHATDALGIRVARLRRPQELPSAGWRDVFPHRSLALGVTYGIGLAAGSMWLAGRLLDTTVPWWVYAAAAPAGGFAGALRRGRGVELVARSPLSMITGLPSPRRPLPPLETETRALGPRDVWRHHSRLLLPLGLLNGVAVALYSGCLGVLLHGSASFGVAIGVAIGSGYAVLSGVLGNLAAATAATAVQLSVREGTPVRLMAFLHDAHLRGLLRASGPAYEFRHRRLQERLAREP
ncbi:hypothetical protein [Streptomyces sp. NPDC013455]|uniref:hypothetical protein n=1 Tax=Streptomyces sp. NPDC013455 TaxID=3155605 RepID=UPI0033E8ECE1